MNVGQNKIAIFASGAGSNALKILEHTALKKAVSLIVCNNPDAGVLNIAKNNNIATLMLKKAKFIEDGYVEELKKANINLIILAGFLWKVPVCLVNAYPKGIVNIHPALLPKFGGKGMYGNHVHQAVMDAKETETGITIHFVDELYDHGQIIMQANCMVEPADNTSTIAKKVLALEHKHFASTIALLGGYS